MTTTHAGPSTVWTGKLAALLPALTRELADRREQWVYRTLPNGAMVALRIRQVDGHRVVRIARKDRPADELAWKRWAKEVETFQSHLGIQRWRSTVAESKGGVAVAFVEGLES